MSLLTAILLFSSAFAAGILNSVAGGGSFVSFPALLLGGFDPLIANATNTVALWPGSIASAGAYRHQFTAPSLRRLLLPFVAATALGAAIGAGLLLGTPVATFRRLVPWLMLAATLVFTLGDAASRHLARRARRQDGGLRKRALWLATAAMLLTAVYIGYFGAGAGIVMLALFSTLSFGDIHAMNALKTLLATIGNGIAVTAFALAGVVAWPQALVMLTGAVVGGWLGARFAQRFEPARVRRWVSVLAALLTIALFRTHR